LLAKVEKLKNTKTDFEREIMKIKQEKMEVEKSLQIQIAQVSYIINIIVTVKIRS